MLVEYSCDLCNKVYKRKGDLTRHQNNKTCVASTKEIDQTKKINKTKEINQTDEITLTKEIDSTKKVIGNNKTALKNFFKSCLDILRDNEALTGEKALRNMSYLLILKLLEPHFDGEIKIDSYDRYNFGKGINEDTKNNLFKIARLSNLSKVDQDDIPKYMEYLWKYILSVHPSTEKIFLTGKNFDIQNKYTYKKLIDILNSQDLSNTDIDVLGNAYEEVIQDIMTGKVLGQFFTQPLIKKMMVKLINPQIQTDGTFETCGDPTMGTGGFLITYLKYILQQAKEKNIKPNWEFIKTEGLYGKEIEPDTYQLAVSNMLISSGHMFEQLERGDSIRDPITRKFDNILANPPFGIKGLKYDDFESSMKSEYVPIKSDNAVSLFIQAIIYMLKLNGKCAIIVPNGQDLFSKNKNLVAVREYLMKTCDLKEIINLRSGIFTYTSIKTCVFYFIKKKEGNEVMKTEIKISKTQKEMGRNYSFVNEHQTSLVKFYDYNEIEDSKKLLVEVPIEHIASNSYSLNYAEYMKEETKEKYGEDIEMKTLEEIFGEKTNNCINLEENTKYNVVGLSSKGYSKITKELYGREINIKRQQTCNKSQFVISKILNGCYGIISDETNNGIISSEYWLFNINKDIINEKYLYYIFEEQIYPTLKKISNGVGIPRINYSNFKSIKIPIPSLERQHEIVKYLDFIYEKAIKSSEEKIAELKQLNEYCLNNQKLYGNNVVKELGEVCIVNPENLKSGKYTEINYIDISSVKGGQILEIQKLTTEFPSRAKRIVRQGDILYSSIRPNLKGYVYINDIIQNCIASTGFAQIRVKETNIVLSEYLYYIMTCNNITDELVSKAKGAQYPAVSFEDFEKLEIPIPSLERQKEIVDYCEFNDNLIKQLEKEIEQNKKQAQQFIAMITKSQITHENTESTKDSLEEFKEDSHEESKEESDEQD